MASLLIYGGDQLGSIPKQLENIGFHHILHIDGRKTRTVKKEIPENVDLILILTDFINHNLAKKIKARAEKKDIPICYSRRSWCAIYQSLMSCEKACDNCPFLKT
ncbi:DUF2325 domain-containing protein [Evansella cellulosilytica]|uniref:Dihydroorotate dehydrogenase n=1 Tax=Evansella cellulosilytica (strain ATCC 21833 / DSM 2522 / FERM P-1141 / JCM 9156 / N-4) TaxID=649639 RepID=E6TQW1_EVAC2|nr:DUF2325 domain-containing protein [Evansella cellulosilytica]ADU31736.1 hypothetical protein Bcell_3494 [Evansella cellulosilytica DSM 2522]